MLFPLLPGGFLHDSGWTASIRADSPRKKTGEALPWLTMPLVSFLEPKLTTAMSVGEYGGGNSTEWLASRVLTVVTVEHHPEWAQRIRDRQMPNVEVRVPVCDGQVQLPADAFRVPAACPEYASSLDGLKLDLVIVDGLDRNSCVWAAIENGIGVIIVDNTDERYASDLAPSFEALLEGNYRRFDFTGAAPGSWRKTSTSAFLAPTNCLNL